MKILWFTKTPAGASAKLNYNVNYGGWIRSQEEHLTQDENIELSICFYWGEKMTPFFYNKTTYYPVYVFGNNSKILRLFSRVFRLKNDKKQVFNLINVINTVNPDIIHIHGTEENFGLIQSYTKIPVVVSLQGILSPYIEKYFSGVPFCTAFIHERVIPKLFYRSASYLFRIMQKSALREREILKQTKYIIGRTDWDRRISHLLGKQCQYYVGNEIIRDEFYQKVWNKNQFGIPIHLVTVMSEGLYKGLENLVKTAQRMEEFGKFEFKWTVIGQSEYNDTVKIVKRWLKINFTDLNIELVGEKDATEMVKILLEADIYCQVSHIENSPNSLCEAMLLGLPIIASFVGGTDSMLEHKKEGILIQDGDSFSLAGTIIELSQNFPLAKSYGSRAHEKAKTRHNKELISNQLINTYKQIKALEKL